MQRDASLLFAVTVVLLLVVDAAAIYPLVGGGNDPGEDPEDPSGYIIVTDVLGREVEVPRDVSKIVCIAAGSLRLVSYMGASDLVVGIDRSDSSDDGRNDYATYHLAYDYSSVANVGNADNETSYKAIKEAGAQLIIASKTTVDENDTIQTMTGIPVVAISAGGDISVTDPEFRKNIEVLGKALCREARASELLDGIDSVISELEGFSSAVSDSKRCYIGGLTYYKQSGLYMTSGNYMSFVLAGAENVMPEKTGLPYSIEIPSRLAEADPEYIFIDSMTRDSSRTQYYEDEAILSSISAIGNDRDYLLFSDKYYGTNWEAELMNAYVIGQIIHPSVYAYDLREKLNGVLGVFFPDSEISVKDIYKAQGWTPEEGWL